MKKKAVDLRPGMMVTADRSLIFPVFGIPEKSRGMTLIEILVVMFIISLTWTYFLPRLGELKGGGDDAALRELNSFMARIEQHARAEETIQEIVFTKNERRIGWRDDSLGLGGYISSIRMNGREVMGKSEAFRIYPGGISDQAAITLSSGVTYNSIPLIARFSAGEK